MGTVDLESIDICGVLTSLAENRSVFHSEADFQHAFAWEIQHAAPDCDIRLEYRFPDPHKRIYLDIWVRDAKSALAIELKYKTRGLRTTVGEEVYELLDQSAQDIGRYDFLKDVQRLEQVAAGRSGSAGYAILLTNDSSYWAFPRDGGSVDAAFRLHEGRVLTGKLGWDVKAAPGTTRTREEPIVLRASYELRWRDYSDLGTKSYGRFRYLLLRAGQGRIRPLPLDVSDTSDSGASV